MFCSTSRSNFLAACLPVCPRLARVTPTHESHLRITKKILSFLLIVFLFINLFLQRFIFLYFSWNCCHPMIDSILIILSLVFRWIISMGPYSGQGKGPLHGDFEAQRHWMELTNHLPVDQWYFYDLEYWGLDYPPLTAYHMKLCGYVGGLFNPDWFALATSRGIESADSKIFMRLTVIISDVIVYIPGTDQNDLQKWRHSDVKMTSSWSNFDQVESLYSGSREIWPWGIFGTFVESCSLIGWSWSFSIQWCQSRTFLDCFMSR